MAKFAREAPADTRMMGIVHSALRRDLVRARIVVAGGEAEAVRRAALGSHLLWLMDVLRRHHQGEDEILFPLVVRHNPDAGGLVAVMDAEHVAIQPAVDSVEEAARNYRDGAEGCREELLVALVALDTVLLPHLGREETEMLPVVAASLTEAQWREWEDATDVRSRPLGELAHDLHWLLDGADAEARAKLLGQVPAMPRLLLRGWRLPYARRARALWAGTPATDVPALTLALFPSWS